MRRTRSSGNDRTLSDGGLPHSCSYSPLSRPFDCTLPVAVALVRAVTRSRRISVADRCPFSPSSRSTCISAWCSQSIEKNTQHRLYCRCRPLSFSPHIAAWSHFFRFSIVQPNLELAAARAAESLRSTTHLPAIALHFAQTMPGDFVVLKFFLCNRTVTHLCVHRMTVGSSANLPGATDVAH